MSSNAGGKAKLITVKFYTCNGIVQSVIKKRELEKLRLNKHDHYMVYDIYGSQVIFYSYEVIK